MHTYFELENKREQYARSGDNESFIATYHKGKVIELKNENSPRVWESQLAEIAYPKDPMTRDRIRITAQLIHNLPHRQLHILDIGIGNGWVEKMLISRYKRKFSLTGVDIVSRNLKKLSRKLHGTFYTEDILKLPQNLGTYNCIVLLEVLEHISPKDTFKALKAIKKHLYPEGDFILSVPIYENIEEKIKKGTNISRHVRRYTPEIILKELEIAGFHIIATKKLYAFSFLYRIKSLLARVVRRGQPNILIIHAQHAHMNI